VDAVILHDALLDSGGTAGGEILVVGIGAHRVGVAFEHQVDVVVGLHGVGHGGQFIAVDVAYHGLVELELHVEAHGDGAGLGGGFRPGGGAGCGGGGAPRGLEEVIPPRVEPEVVGAAPTAV